MRYFLGADLGGTKTHVVIADEAGCAVGFGESGPGNHQTVGFDGMYNTLREAVDGALNQAGLQAKDIAGAGFGIAGYDWRSEKPKMAEVISKFGFSAPYEMVNDSIPGLVAGSEEGWGVGLVSGTGCNCRGWDKNHQREGRVTGYGITMGEAAGGSELVFRAMQLVGFEWTQRGPKTALTQAFMQHTGAKDIEDLLEGYTEEYYAIGAAAAPLVFEVARQGDAVALDLIRWAGQELGQMANGVIRQLGFEALDFDVVLAGSMFQGGALLIDPLRETIQQLAPGARLVRLTVPPVIGAVLIGMEQACPGFFGSGAQDGPRVRQILAETVQKLHALKVDD